MQIRAGVPLLISSPAPSSACQPVTVGIPFPKGRLTDPASLRLLDSAGRSTPLQVQPLAHWSDGSVQWLLLDFILPSLVAGRTSWRLAEAAWEGASRAPSVQFREHKDFIRVDTGAAAFHVDRATLAPVTSARRDGQDILDPKCSRIVLTDPRGHEGTARVEQLTVEAAGPVRGTLRAEGCFEGRVPCRFRARLCFFAGTGLVRLRLTVHNPNRAEHPGGLWDLGDRGSLLFRDLRVELGLRDPHRPGITWIAEPEHAPSCLKGEKLEIYQDSSGGVNWRSRNHVNSQGQVPCHFQGYRVRSEGEDGRGLRASPVVALDGPGGQLTAAVPEFWQQFPKAIEAEGRHLRLRLFPEQFGDLFELQGGEQKTHTLWLHFSARNPLPMAALDWVHQPARVQAAPAWVVASQALFGLAPAQHEGRGMRDEGREDSPPAPCSSPLTPRPSPLTFLQELTREAVGGVDSFFAKRERIDEYGWRHFGEVYADHEDEHFDGPKPVISHYNNQYDLVHGTLLHYLRTGDPRWYDLLAPLARHVIDIDIYHTDRDRSAYNGGLFWFTDHYKDAATCSHRTYSAKNCRPGDRAYGGGPSSNHNFTTGLLHYYFLTGDPEGARAVTSLADWVINMDDGTQNLFGLLDPGPSGLASYTGNGSYHGPGRGAGNSVNALLDAWLLGRERRYLDKAEALIRRCIHPADDIAGRDLLNVEKRWSYTVFLTVLARYLRIKAEVGELDFMYAYARASLIAYAEWMVEHERPYFDHPEHLEFVTEAWPGQELRKANVLRLAAAYTDEPLRSRLVGRGHELAERAWRDLFAFSSRTSARALALVMVEGSLDAYLRVSPIEPAPRPLAQHEFGTPVPFVAQKQRVAAQLKTFSGLIRAVGALASAKQRQTFFSLVCSHAR